MKTIRLIILAVALVVLVLSVVPASAKTIAASTVDTSVDMTRTDDATVTSFFHENIQLVQKDDGSYVWFVHSRISTTIKYDDGYTYREAYNYPLVTIGGVNDYNVITGAYISRFESGGYTDLFHSDYTYSNGEIQVNHYWEKAS